MAALEPGVTNQYRLTIAGPVPLRLADMIAERFDDVRIHPDGPDTVLDVSGADQSALRALLTLLWDAGHDVRFVSSLGDA